MASPQDPGIPPKSPDVADQQQGGDLAQYAQQAQQAGVGQPKPPSGVELIEKILNDIAQQLTKIVEVANMVDPMYAEYATKMAQVGSLFMKSVQQAKQQKQTQGAGPQAGLDPSRGGAEGSANSLEA